MPLAMGSNVSRALSQLYTTYSIPLRVIVIIRLILGTMGMILTEEDKGEPSVFSRIIIILERGRHFEGVEELCETRTSIVYR